MSGTILNIQNITNLYLFGTEERPPNLASEQFIRPENAEGFVVVDGAQFMSEGAGRFALGAAFELIQDFFNDSSLGAGQYSKDELVLRYGLSSITLNINQFELDDAKGDYQERVYIYNQTAFMISESANFVVLSDGTKQIQNFSIFPYGHENFDYEGSNPVINLFQSFLLNEKIDPSKIGRTVDMVFDLSEVPEYTYTYQDFAFETVKWSQYTHVTNIAGLLDMPAVVDDLFNAGTINFTQDGLAVRWLTNGDDVGGNTSPTPSASQLGFHPIMSDAALGGQIVMMGAGSDEFVLDWGGPDARFDLYGGAGVDQVTSLDQNDSYWSVQLHNVEYFTGSEFSDVVEVLSSGTDITSISTGGGDDEVTLAAGVSASVNLGAGSDSVYLSSAAGGFISGGDDFDWVDFSNYTHGIEVTYSSALFVDDYLLTSFEGLTGTAYGDHLTGAHVIFGGDGGDDVITVTDGYAAGDEGNDTLTVTRGQAYGREGNDIINVTDAEGYGGDGDDIIDVTDGKAFGDAGNDLIHSHSTTDVVRGGFGDDTVYILEGTADVAGDDGFDVLNIAGHIDPYNGYNGFEEVHASQENDVVSYTDGRKSVRTFEGNDTINVVLHRQSPSAVDDYFIDGGNGVDVVTVKVETSGTTLTIKNIETVIDPVANKSIAWIAAAGERQPTSSNQAVWFVDDGFSRYSLYVVKQYDYATTGKVSIGYGFTQDIRLEGDSPGYGIGMTVVGYHSGDLGITF